MEIKDKKRESFIQVNNFMNRICNQYINKEYISEIYNDIQTQAAIALLRRPEIIIRGMKLFGERYSYYDISFADFLYNYVNFSLLYQYSNFRISSQVIVENMQEMEAIVRCAEALKSGVSKEDVYKKYIGYTQDEDSIDNLYFCSRLNLDQKKFICSELDHIFQEDKNIFITKVFEEKQKFNKCLKR